MDTISFATSAFPPLALGFFGLGTGYLIYGPEELFKWPKREGTVDEATGVWALWMPGFCQFVAGTILFIGMALGTFKAAPLYMAAFAFSAYGIHWFAMGWLRIKHFDARTSMGMCIAYFLISILGGVVFFVAGDHPVGWVFVGLTLIYICDFFVTIGRKKALPWLGLWHLATGLLLMYCMIATGLNFSLGWHLAL